MELNVYGGIVQNDGDIYTVNVYGGVLDNHGDCPGPIALTGGVMYYRGEGTTPGVTLSGDGVLDVSLDMRARTLNSISMYQGAALRDPWSTVTYDSDGITLQQCGLDDVTVDIGSNVKFTPTVIS